jgi:hypothetical protein
MATAAFGRGKVSGFVPILRTHHTMAVVEQSPLPGKIRTIWRQHDGDCGFWSGQVSGFVPILKTHHTMGVVGQSPLPEKEPRDFEDTGRKRA